MCAVVNAEPDDAAPVLRPGLRLDSVIARGSFGVVFRGRQLAVDRDVAIKVLHAGFAPDTEPEQLFRDEVRAIGNIDHRNVVRVFDADDTTDGRTYFVMELLDGPTLQQLAEAGPLPAPRAVALVAQLLDGLAAVHAAGHIHADVKPSNAVVVDDHGTQRVVLIDFGLSRLRRPGQPTEAVGGTRAYMAPEQLRAWQIDARSDVFSAALILVRLVTGWERSEEAAIAPPLDGVADLALRVALERALALDPAQRPSAADFARALRGGHADEAAPPGPPPPFRDLAPMTEHDRGRLLGRQADIVRLARRLESGRAVIFTAPSGTGKTSLLRAGLVPYLDASGIAHVYAMCETGATAALARAIHGAADSLAAALRAWRAARGCRLVVILDQFEAVLTGTGEGEAMLDALLDPELRARDIDVVVVIGVREDFVARLLAAPALTDGAPQVRLGPLDRESARAALVQPLAEHGVTLAPDLLELLLDDLTRASSELGADLGWTGAASVFPPHLQLAGGTLFDVIGAQETVLTVEHYRRLGGFEAIVGEHLERTLGELSLEDRAVARDLFLALVASAQTRAVRAEADVLDTVGGRHGEASVRRMLERLAAHRLVVRRIAPDGVPTWSLVHDTLVPRISVWLTVHDLDRRRVAEMVRFHLRQSQPDAPAILEPRQLRALARFPDLLDELEAEWARRPSAAWTPKLLVLRSRQAARYRRGIVGSVAFGVLAVTAILLVRWLDERDLRRGEARLRELNLGRFELEIAPFDWCCEGSASLVQLPVDTAELPHLVWTLHDPDIEDPDSPGHKVEPPRLVGGMRSRGRDGSLVETGIEARGGDAFLKIDGRGIDGESCSPSIIRLRRLPGHGDRRTVRRLRIALPTCRATRLDTVEIPAGVFEWGGRGEPPTRFSLDYLPPATRQFLPAYRIDRTEITNAAFAVFAAMSEVHDIWASEAPEYLHARGPNFPRADIDWFDARAYCRFLGKDLPSSRQWQKALRGGLELHGAPNPHPGRNLPWGLPAPLRGMQPVAIALDAGDGGRANDIRKPFPVGCFELDVSPYGVVDLAGSLQEWTGDVEPGVAPWLQRSRLTRGGNWFNTDAELLTDFMAIQNPRSPRVRMWYLGARCVINE